MRYTVAACSLFLSDYSTFLLLCLFFGLIFIVVFTSFSDKNMLVNIIVAK